MNAFDIVEFVAEHPEHLATISKVVAAYQEITKADPTFVSDITKLVQDLTKKA